MAARNFESCIHHHDNRVIPLRRDYVLVAGDLCSALILAQFEWRTNCLIESASRSHQRNVTRGPAAPPQDTDLWFHVGHDELVIDLFNLFDIKTVKRRLKSLEYELRWVESRPDLNDRRRRQYRLLIARTQAACDATAGRPQSGSQSPLSAGEFGDSGSPSLGPGVPDSSKVGDSVSTIGDSLTSNVARSGSQSPRVEHEKPGISSAGRALDSRDSKSKIARDRDDALSASGEEPPEQPDIAAVRAAMEQAEISPSVINKLLPIYPPDVLHRYLADLPYHREAWLRSPRRNGEPFVASRTFYTSVTEKWDHVVPIPTAAEERAADRQRQADHRTVHAPRDPGPPPADPTYAREIIRQMRERAAKPKTDSAPESTTDSGAPGEASTQEDE